ncbi:E3 ubiquitin-protein ligase TRIM39-like [Hyperolius riggenbachi]|uniref:E3 ubiquitin-protein ligase TRIM39-like n=1 Tax=Hyperolius riggenbachi TaxID=752182 RepID=UPI0035A2651E
MASADLNKLLDCSVCQNIYTDPVNLKCGHSFCRVCIDQVLDTQVGSEGYSCPECREKFQERPALHRNIILSNIAENFLSPHPGQESAVCCTYCIHTHVPAVSSCLLCEASLCASHLNVHSKSPEHVLVDPSMSPEDRKRSLHKKILEYNYTENSDVIHVSCCVIGMYRNHQKESLDEIAEKEKQKLNIYLQKLLKQREWVENRVHSLQVLRKKTQDKVDGETRSFIDIFTELRIQLEHLEKKVLSEIARQAERVQLPILHQIQELEINMDELSRKMRQTEELHSMTDPLTVLQDMDKGETEEEDDDRERCEEYHDVGDLDMVPISQVFRKGLAEILTGTNGGIYIQEATDIVLDENSATSSIRLSDDFKTATLIGGQNHPETPESFTFYPQVISKGSFSSGRLYWEVDLRGSHLWKVGMCYPSIQRKGGERSEGGMSGLQEIGYNNKSWVMEKWDGKYFVIHHSRRNWLADNITGEKIRVYLDYEAGQLSFYDLSEPIRHLHTFTATFTEPLHVALLIWDDNGFIRVKGCN